MNKYFNIKKISFLVITICVLLLTIGFSAFQDTLFVDNMSAYIRVEKDIRVTGFTVGTTTNGGTSNYLDYSAESITSGISLPNSNSTITYNVNITNIGNVEMGILNISGLPSNLKYTLSNYSIEDKLCDDSDPTDCKLGSSSTLSITIGYDNNGFNSSNTNYQLLLTFSFARVYNITYNGFANTTGLDTTIIEGNTKTITFNNTTGIPYDVKVTNAISSYTSPNLTLTNPTDDVIIDRYFHITYNLNGGTNSNNNQDKFLSADTITLEEPTHPTDYFDGWYEQSNFSGTVVTSISGRSSDIILYAKWASSIMTYNISYELNGGTQANNQVTTFRNTPPQTILDPTNSHDALFDGWYQNSSFTGSKITSTSQLTGSTTLYASWVGTINNMNFDTTTGRFNASNTSSGIKLQNFTRDTNYQYIQGSAHTTINSVRLFITYTSSNKTASLTCQVGTTTSTMNLNTNQNNTTVDSLITLPNPIQVDASYTVSCTGYTGDNNGKIKINGFAILVNP